jgi:hypothetical protein
MVETTFSKTHEEKSILERNELTSNTKTEKRKSILVDLSTPRAIRGLLQTKKTLNDVIISSHGHQFVNLLTNQTQNRLQKTGDGKSCRSYYQMNTSSKALSSMVKIIDKSPLKLSYRNALPDKHSAVSLRRESNIVRSIKPKSMTSKKNTWGNTGLKREKAYSYNYAKIKGNKENTSSAQTYKKSTISLSQNHGFAVKTMSGLSSNKKLGGTKNIEMILK